ALVHHAEPEVLVAVEAHGERAGREARLQLGHRELRDRARARVELAQRLLAEVRVPGDAVGIHDDVVRLDGRPRQVVLRDDDARPAPDRAGSVFNAYSQRGAELRLIEARNSACSRRKRSRSSPRISSWRSASRSWGWSGVLWFAYLPMRGSTCCMKPAASCDERMMRSSV